MPLAVHLNRLEEWQAIASSEGHLAEAVRLTVSEVGGPRAENGEFSITFVRRDEIQLLNHRYLDRDRPTDVIAFDLGADEEVLGDIYISPEMATEHADELGLSVTEEVVRLAVHGVLHVLGHDHPEDEGREESDMFRLQEELLARLRQG